ncbi:jg19949 [Pararge aegeria aegeria]|uniref:Jg19949 protein n=1 Tax=Pararge aegeria aegeria TaxID=348720 RepID=A0A8S4RYR8_9NEOP|nr:jg19949 [Pararge aegeria aegeria]
MRRGSLKDCFSDVALFTVSRYGRPVIELDGYRYNRRSHSKGVRGYWSCNRAPSGCRAILVTMDDVLTATKRHHNSTSFKCQVREDQVRESGDGCWKIQIQQVELQYLYVVKSHKRRSVEEPVFRTDIAQRAAKLKWQSSRWKQLQKSFPGSWDLKLPDICPGVVEDVVEMKMMMMIVLLLCFVDKESTTISNLPSADFGSD